METPLKTLLELHATWVATSSAKGRQLDLSDHDLRLAEGLGMANLTAMIAVDAVFCGVDLSKCQLAAARLSGSDFRFALLNGADLRGADLRNARFQNARLAGANMRALRLETGQNLTTRLSGADLRYADLRKLCLRGADLREADLSNALLQGADLRGADLRGATLGDPVRLGAQVDETTQMSDI